MSTLKKRAREENSTSLLNIRQLKRTKQSIESVDTFTSNYNSHKVFIGTSGYSHPSWHNPGSFYPKGMRDRELEYYMQQFNSVELNYSYYRTPSEKSVVSWKEKADANRPNFLFVIKVNRWFTHMKLIIVDEVFREKWEKFWSICQLLRITWDLSSSSSLLGSGTLLTREQTVSASCTQSCLPEVSSCLSSETLHGTVQRCTSCSGSLTGVCVDCT